MTFLVWALVVIAILALVNAVAFAFGIDVAGLAGRSPDAEGHGPVNSQGPESSHEPARPSPPDGSQAHPSTAVHTAHH